MIFDIDEALAKIKFLTKKGGSVALFKNYDTIKIVMFDKLAEKIINKGCELLGVFDSNISDYDLRIELEYLKQN